MKKCFGNYEKAKALEKSKLKLISQQQTKHTQHKNNKI